MTPEERAAWRALQCLYIAVEKHVADDVSAKVSTAFEAIKTDHAALKETDNDA